MTTIQHVLQNSLREQRVDQGSNAVIHYLIPHGMDGLRGHVVRSDIHAHDDGPAGRQIALLCSSTLYPTNQIFHGHNFGQALYRSSDGRISIHAEVKGNSLLDLYGREEYAARGLRYPVKTFQRLADLPQQQWDDFTRELKFAYGIGVKVDLAPSNIMLSKKGLTLVDVAMPADGMPVQTQQHLHETVQQLMDGLLPMYDTDRYGKGALKQADSLAQWIAIPQTAAAITQIQEKLSLAMQHCAFDQPLDLTDIAPPPALLELPSHKPGEHAERLAASLQIARGIHR